MLIPSYRDNCDLLLKTVRLFFSWQPDSCFASYRLSKALYYVVRLLLFLLCDWLVRDDVSTFLSLASNNLECALSLLAGTSWYCEQDVHLLPMCIFASVVCFKAGVVAAVTYREMLLVSGMRKYTNTAPSTTKVPNSIKTPYLMSAHVQLVSCDFRSV